MKENQKGEKTNKVEREGVEKRDKGKRRGEGRRGREEKGRGVQKREMGRSKEEKGMAEWGGERSGEGRKDYSG